MILCTRSTSTSSEQSTKRRSRSENMRKVCLFYSQNNKIVWLSNMGRHIFLRNSWGAQRFVGFFSWLCFSVTDWLGRQIWWKIKWRLKLSERVKNYGWDGPSPLTESAYVFWFPTGQQNSSEGLWRFDVVCFTAWRPCSHSDYPVHSFLWSYGERLWWKCKKLVYWCVDSWWYWLWILSHFCSIHLLVHVLQADRLKVLFEALPKSMDPADVETVAAKWG